APTARPPPPSRSTPSPPPRARRRRGRRPRRARTPRARPPAAPPTPPRGGRTPRCPRSARRTAPSRSPAASPATRCPSAAPSARRTSRRCRRRRGRGRTSRPRRAPSRAAPCPARGRGRGRRTRRPAPSAPRARRRAGRCAGAAAPAGAGPRRGCGRRGGSFRGRRKGHWPMGKEESEIQCLLASGPRTGEGVLRGPLALAAEAVLLGEPPAPLGGGPVVLGERTAEPVPPTPVRRGDEVQVVVLLGVEDGVDAGLRGVRDGAGGEAVYEVGVVGAGEAVVREQEAAHGAAVGEHEGVLDRRVGLEAHPP